MQKLMILGAGVYQMPVIRQAQQMSLFTIAISNLPNDPGLKAADKAYLCSTLAREQVLSIAREEQIDGIITVASEIAVPTAAYVAHHLGLPGLSQTTANNISDKYRLREVLHKAQLSSVRFARVDNATQANQALKLVPLPAVLKPLLASGSRGVQVITDAGGLIDCLPKSIALSAGEPGAILEEFVQGTEFGGQAVFENSELIFFMLTRKVLNGLVTTGHLLPPDLPEQLIHKARQLISLAATALNMSNGSLNFDMMLTGEHLEILELGGRLGGNGLVDLAHYHNGSDLLQAVIRMALGQKAGPIEANKAEPAAVFIIGSTRSGKLQRIRQFNEVFPNHQHCLLAQSDFALPGLPVQEFTQGSFQLGSIFFTAPTFTELARLMQQVKSADWVVLEPE